MGNVFTYTDKTNTFRRGRERRRKGEGTPEGTSPRRLEVHGRTADPPLEKVQDEGGESRGGLTSTPRQQWEPVEDYCDPYELTDVRPPNPRTRRLLTS